jgi:hypothetical protein
MSGKSLKLISEEILGKGTWKGDSVENVENEFSHFYKRHSIWPFKSEVHKITFNKRLA